MKLLKKPIIILLALSLLLSLTGCGNKNIEGSLEDIMEKVYAGIADDQKPMGLSNMEVTEETVEGFLGTDKIEYKEALASESMVGSIAHSVVLVRTKEGADVEKIKETIKDKVNPRKWICVEASNVVVESKGDLVVLIMSDAEATPVAEHLTPKLEANFNNL